MSADNKSIPSQALTTREWCALHRISLSHYNELKRKGLAPQTIKVGGGAIRTRERITPEATAEWRKRMAERSTPKLKARMESRGFVLVRVTKNAVEFISQHPTLEDAEAALVANHPNEPDIQIHERLVRVEEEA